MIHPNGRGPFGPKTNYPSSMRDLPVDRAYEEEIPLKLTHLGTASGNTGCPAVYSTDRGTYVVQGWKLADTEARAQLDIPDHEDAIEIPAALLRYFPRTG